MNKCSMQGVLQGKLPEHIAAEVIVSKFDFTARCVWQDKVGSATGVL